MIRNFKVLGLAFGAIFALGAIAASAALAQTNGVLTTEGNVPVTLDLKEDGTNVITLFGAKVECPGSIMTDHKTLTVAETEAGKTHELIPVGSSTGTVTPHLTNCKAEEGTEAHKITVTMNGCDFDFRIGETIGVTSTYSAQAGLVCPTGKDVQMEIYPFSNSELGGIACTITIQAANNQTLAGAVLSNVSGLPDDLTVTGELGNVVATRSGVGCASEEDKAGKIDVNVTIEGTNSLGSRVGVTVTH